MLEQPFRNSQLEGYENSNLTAVPWKTFPKCPLPPFWYVLSNWFGAVEQYYAFSETPHSIEVEVMKLWCFQTGQNVAILPTYSGNLNFLIGSSVARAQIFNFWKVIMSRNISRVIMVSQHQMLRMKSCLAEEPIFGI